MSDQARHCEHDFLDMGRLMEEADLKPHQQYWLVPPPQFEEKVKDICECYLGALDSAEQGERTVCIDEMTGIQALEQVPGPTHASRSAQSERV